MFVVIKVALMRDNDRFYHSPATWPESVVFVGPDRADAEAAQLAAGGVIDPKNSAQHWAAVILTYE